MACDVGDEGAVESPEAIGEQEVKRTCVRVAASARRCRRRIFGKVNIATQTKKAAGWSGCEGLALVKCEECLDVARAKRNFDAVDAACNERFWFGEVDRGKSPAVAKSFPDFGIGFRASPLRLYKGVIEAS